jgi:hypothetical protein
MDSFKFFIHKKFFEIQEKELEIVDNQIVKQETVNGKL